MAIVCIVVLLTSAGLAAPASAQVATDSPGPTPDPTTSPSPPPSPDPTPTPSPGPTGGPLPPPKHPGPPRKPGEPAPGPAEVPGIRRGPHPRAPGRDDPWAGWKPALSGSYSTESLDRVARRMRRAGEPDWQIAREVYRPFIVEGPATWSDSWHAPRYAGGFHLHEGQDVLCRYGAPVLAATPGRLEFGSNSLGGLVAYIRHADGSFLYYAHLSAYREGWNGASVRPGQVIGYCGATGDATVPHVHFGTYDANGVARNPMRSLVGWLHEAERRNHTRSEPSDVWIPPTEAGEVGIATWSLTSDVTADTVVMGTITLPVSGGRGTVLDATALLLAMLLPVGAVAAWERMRRSTTARAPILPARRN